jgi:uncharacterized protein (TIGR03643 family)
MKIEDIDRIIEMAWEDRTPFEAIEFQFGIKEKKVEKQNIVKHQNQIDSNHKIRNNMESLMWLAVAGVVIVVGKKIGKYLWPEDWENYE